MTYRTPPGPHARVREPLKNKPNYLKASEHLLNAVADFHEGQQAKSGGRYLSVQYRENAKQTRRKGEQDSARIRHRGELTASNAKVQMAMQGAIIDNETLNRIKRQSTLDSIATMYAAKAEALTLDERARQAREQGKREHRMSTIKATSNVIKAFSSFGNY